MEAGGVVSDVIDLAPATRAEVTWEGGVKADMGNVVTPTQIQNQPTVTWPSKEGALYAVVMTDPDAPSRANPKAGEWRHWLVINVPGNDVNGGDARSEYIGAGPPQGTGLHRYVFLVYKQPGQIHSDSVPFVANADPNGRAKWKVREFARTHGLGNPVAGNYLQAEFDDYVPKLYAKFAESEAQKKKASETAEG